MRSIIYIFFILCLINIGCTTSDHTLSKEASRASILGELQHGFTLNQQTQESFNKGLLLLHNFEYDDALVAFEQATALDSTEVLTHWGEAMCHYKALWKLQNTEKGKSILARFGSSKDKRLAFIKDPIEKVMWELVEIMYGEGEFKERNKAIKKHLKSAHETYPTHQEIAAFYALSIIWSTEEYGNGSDDLRLAASICDKISEVNPYHPGALHYKIHALDGPTSAKDALDAANTYSKVAADATHALHMPSHIYLALGKWDGVVNSNQESYEASVKRMKKLDLKDGSRGYHSLSWLHYGLLQQGQYTKAEKILNDMLSYVPKDPTKGARGYILGMQSRQLSQAGIVSETTALDLNVKVDDIGIIAQSIRSFLRAQIAFQNEEIDTINEEIDWLSKNIYIASQSIEGAGIAMCAAGTTRYAPTENSIKIAQVIKNQIQALAAMINGDDQLFEVHMKNAVQLEEDTNFPAGPPSITKPSYEQYGEWLLKKGKYAEAAELFDKALSRMPRRSKSLIGKMTAMQKLNQVNEVKRVKDELHSILSQADDEVKALLN